MSDDTWIGLNDHSTEGSWQWLENMAALGSYTNWYGTNPNVDNTIQNCVVKKKSQNGEWDDVGCGKDLALSLIHI